jgi:hypothetical protein
LHISLYESVLPRGGPVERHASREYANVRPLGNWSVVGVAEVPMITVKTGARRVAANVLTLAAVVALGLEAIQTYRTGIGHPPLLMLIAGLLTAAAYFIGTQVRERATTWGLIMMLMLIALVTLREMLR